MKLQKIASKAIHDTCAGCTGHTDTHAHTKMFPFTFGIMRKLMLSHTMLPALATTNKNGFILFTFCCCCQCRRCCWFSVSALSVVFLNTTRSCEWMVSGECIPSSYFLLRPFAASCVHSGGETKTVDTETESEKQDESLDMKRATHALDSPSDTPHTIYCTCTHIYLIISLWRKTIEKPWNPMD